ncbi:hypothetical protein Cgig2_018928 [Carnegiea gigantea]|uniref:Uncharacterized protein n=1 Tax=Carnegiea gigantea TaxID=171969 RepID=A0A9Q1K5N5_9CARY|nr:hypothetical protein Cgig2_018928 [Carnegiea gigantea]
MAPLRLRARERIRWLTFLSAVCQTTAIGRRRYNKCQSSDPRGVRKDEGNRASTRAHSRVQIRTNNRMHPSISAGLESTLPTGCVRFARPGCERFARIIEVKQALWKAHNGIAPSRFVTTSYSSKSRGAREGGGDHNRRDLEGKTDNDADCNTKIIATVIGGIDDMELNTGYRKAQVWKLSWVMATGGLRSLRGPTMTFSLEDIRPLQTHHNDALLIQLKIATTMVRRILMDTGSSVDIIMLECLKRLRSYRDSYCVVQGTSQCTPLEPKDHMSEWATRTTTNRRNKFFSGGHPYSTQCHPGMTNREKIVRRPKNGKGIFLCEFEILGKEGRTPHIQDVSTKPERKEAMVVLSALVEEHGRPRPESTSEVTIQIGKDPNPMINDGSAKLLERYRDVFAFNPFKILGIAPDIMEHKLYVDPNHKLV